MLRPYSSEISQGLADVDPDVDAMYRLTQPLNVSFVADSAALVRMLAFGQSLSSLRAVTNRMPCGAGHCPFPRHCCCHLMVLKHCVQ